MTLVYIIGLSSVKKFPLIYIIDYSSVKKMSLFIE